ncbi:hypothetical protein BBR47_20430 [Brevibacillus brevis NBRC 100599]|uniref:Uncharacterized protein n=1 Tax=Brevibacillus brevis (strain 47 / JCM 6285 / NBRC 100599) TaxID=358681 RepID=C0ZB61_BREBN|nr:hypothetical protein BBR47_20430 [Brevibacillus brevis NBRC 100599]
MEIPPKNSSMTGILFISYEKKREQVILASLVFGVWFVYAK